MLSQQSILVGFEIAHGLSFTHEKALHTQGFSFIAGVDEAGRGALAGPVVAAAVILPLDVEIAQTELAGLNDSKKLTVQQRERLFAVIRSVAVSYGISFQGCDVIAERNILGATRVAMTDAVAQLSPAADFALIDHVKLPELSIPYRAFPKADAISCSVAAASILAKVARDGWMVELDKQYPVYGFARHKGYGTAAHRAALAEHGPCAEHRLSFKGVLADVS